MCSKAQVTSILYIRSLTSVYRHLISAHSCTRQPKF